MPSRRDCATRARARVRGRRKSKPLAPLVFEFCDESSSGRVLERRLCGMRTHSLSSSKGDRRAIARSRAFARGSRRRAARPDGDGTLAPASHVRTAPGARARRKVIFLTQAVCTRRSHLPGVDGARGDADCESPEGDDEDAQAEDEPDVHAAERRRLVPGSLRLVVLLRLLDSALAALLRRGRPVGPPSHHGPPKRIAREEGGGGRAGASRRERRARAREGGAKVRQRPSARRRARRRAGGRRRHDTARRKVMSWPRSGAGARIPPADDICAPRPRAAASRRIHRATPKFACAYVLATPRPAPTRAARRPWAPMASRRPRASLAARPRPLPSPPARSARSRWWSPRSRSARSA